MHCEIRKTGLSDRSQEASIDIAKVVFMVEVVSKNLAQ